MHRGEIYAAIDEERIRQDKAWSDRTQYKKSAPHILVLQGQMNKLLPEWYASSKDALPERFVKIAAIAVRALEEIE